MVRRCRAAQRRPRLVVVRRVRASRGCSSTGSPCGVSHRCPRRSAGDGAACASPRRPEGTTGSCGSSGSAADLDDHDLELAELVRHLLQLEGPLDPPRVLAQLLAEHVAAD